MAGFKKPPLIGLTESRHKMEIKLMHHVATKGIHVMYLDHAAGKAEQMDIEFIFFSSFVSRLSTPCPLGGRGTSRHQCQWSRCASQKKGEAAGSNVMSWV